jgi:hypothetical protein
MWTVEQRRSLSIAASAGALASPSLLKEGGEGCGTSAGDVLVVAVRIQVEGVRVRQQPGDALGDLACVRYPESPMLIDDTITSPGWSGSAPNSTPRPGCAPRL